MLDLILGVEKWLKAHPTDVQAMRDLAKIAKELVRTNLKEGVQWLRKGAMYCEHIIPQLADADLQKAKEIMMLHKDILLETAPYDFDSYLQYVEWAREPSRKFYMPRRTQLRPIVDALQSLADDELDLLAISLPPGCGKTTLAIFYLTWLAGRVPDQPMLTGSHSNSFVRGVYDCLLYTSPSPRDA